MNDSLPLPIDPATPVSRCDCGIPRSLSVSPDESKGTQSHLVKRVGDALRLVLRRFKDRPWVPYDPVDAEIFHTCVEAYSLLVLEPFAGIYNAFKPGNWKSVPERMQYEDVAHFAGDAPDEDQDDTFARVHCFAVPAVMLAFAEFSDAWVFRCCVMVALASAGCSAIVTHVATASYYFREWVMRAPPRLISSEDYRALHRALLELLYLLQSGDDESHHAENKLRLIIDQLQLAAFPKSTSKRAPRVL
jgi:hypothetical protein